MNKLKKPVSTTASKKKSRYELQLETLKGSSRSRITVKESIESKPIKNNVVVPTVQKKVIKRKIVEEEEPKQEERQNKKKKLLPPKIEKVEEEKPKKKKPSPPKVEEPEEEEPKQEEKSNKKKKPSPPPKVEEPEEEEEEEEEKPKKKKSSSKVQKVEEEEEKQDELEQEEEEKPKKKKKEEPKDPFLRYELNGVDQIIDEKNKRLRTEREVSSGAKTLFVKMVKHCVETLDESFKKLDQNKLITVEEAEKEIANLLPSQLITALGEMKVKKNYEPAFGIERWPTLNSDAQSLVCSTLDKFFKFFFDQACKNTKRYHSDFIEAKNVKYLVGESKSLSKMFPSLNTYVGKRRVQAQDNIWEWETSSPDVNKI